MKNLTKRQSEILDYIRSFYSSHGFAPTYRELMHSCNISSLGSVFKHIEGLTSKGYLRKSKHSARSLQPVDMVSKAQENSDSKSVAIIGSISKGKKLEMFAQIQTLELSITFIKTALACYGFLVKDNSFLDEAIVQGDLIIIEAKEFGKPSEMVLVSNQNDEISLCRYKDKKEQKIHGVLVTLVRNYASSSSSDAGSKSSSA
jgi:repressor LexA